MRFVRFAISILVIFIIIFLLSLLLPSKVTVTKSILVSAPLAKVSADIQNLDSWKHWYPAFENKQVNLVNNPSKTGIISSVSFDNGNGKQLKLDLLESKQDTINIIIENQSSTKVGYQFILIPHTGGQTQIAWNVNTTLGWFPWEKAKGIFLDKMSGPQYEAALVNLKKDIEK